MTTQLSTKAEQLYKGTNSTASRNYEFYASPKAWEIIAELVKDIIVPEGYTPYIRHAEFNEDLSLKALWLGFFKYDVDQGYKYLPAISIELGETVLMDVDRLLPLPDEDYIEQSDVIDKVVTREEYLLVVSIEDNKILVEKVDDIILY